MDPQFLLQRLTEIGQSLEQSGHALALIGLGSVGLEVQRLDAYSDLDFFAIVEPGYQQHYLDDLQWLSRLGPVAYAFRNTDDGYKLLFADGIFCEFAVFEIGELPGIPFAPGRIVWKQPQIAETISQPTKALPGPANHGQEWLLGEALTNLYVGMARQRRGERLSALRFIQSYAVDHLLHLAAVVESAQSVDSDPFTPERRIEQRYPALASQMSSWMQGYTRNRESALAILAWLEEHFEVNPAMAEAIRRLCS